MKPIATLLFFTLLQYRYLWAEHTGIYPFWGWYIYGKTKCKKYLDYGPNGRIGNTNKHKINNYLRINQRI